MRSDARTLRAEFGAHRAGVLHGASSNPAAARRIDHIGVVVRDVEAAARVFVERQGMTISGHADLDDGSARLLYLQAGDTTLQLVQPLQAGSLADFLEANGEGLHHVCFEVEALEPALRALPDEADRLGAIYMGGRGCRVVFLGERSAGVLIELTEGTELTDGRPIVSAQSG